MVPLLPHPNEKRHHPHLAGREAPDEQVPDEVLRGHLGEVAGEGDDDEASRPCAATASSRWRIDWSIYGARSGSGSEKGADRR